MALYLALLGGVLGGVLGGRVVRGRTCSLNCPPPLFADTDGRYDYSGRGNVTLFLQLAKEADLFVIWRFGPCEHRDVLPSDFVVPIPMLGSSNATQSLAQLASPHYPCLPS